MKTAQRLKICVQGCGTRDGWRRKVNYVTCTRVMVVIRGGHDGSPARPGADIRGHVTRAQKINYKNGSLGACGTRILITVPEYNTRGVESKRKETPKCSLKRTDHSRLILK